MNCSPEQGYIPELEPEISSSVVTVNLSFPGRFSVRYRKKVLKLKLKHKSCAEFT